MCRPGTLMSVPSLPRARTDPSYPRETTRVNRLLDGARRTPNRRAGARPAHPQPVSSLRSTAPALAREAGWRRRLAAQRPRRRARAEEARRLLGTEALVVVAAHAVC